MKKFLFLTGIFLLVIFSKASAQFEGTFGIGAHAAYGTETKTPGIGAYIRYYYTHSLRFAPSFICYLPHQGAGMWSVETDVHYMFPISVAASLYPIAGINYSNRNFDVSKSSTPAAGNYTRHRLGTSLGLGFQHEIGYRIQTSLELKYQFIKDYSHLVFAAGIGFWF